MGFAENKQQEFTKKIRDLPDQPNMQPHELKEYFDSSPEELRQSHNGLCDALTAKTAASALGFSRTAGVPADTVQAAVENVQQQLNAAVMGNIPSGSVTGDKLAQDVRDRLTAIESAATAEAGTRASGDSNLQNQINTLSTAKCEVYVGIYIGDEAVQREIILGFRPKAIILCDQDTNMRNGSFIYGGIALEHQPASNGVITVTDSGFEIKHDRSNFIYLNLRDKIYYVIAFK